MANNQHSDLEVVPGDLEAGEGQKRAHYAPGYYHDNSDTHKVAYGADDTNKVPYATNYTHNAPSTSLPYQQKQPRTICGLKKKTLWIIVIVAIVLIVAAIGGGVGGALASKGSSSSNSAGAQASSAPSSNPSTSPTPTVIEPSTPITTSIIVGPSSTIRRDCPSSNGTLYTIAQGDTTMQFRKACSATFVNAHGSDAMVVKPFASLNECINECAQYNIRNKTEISQGVSRKCNSVCWRNDFQKRDAWPGGQCFGWTTQNTTTGGFNYEVTKDPKLPVTICDSAILIN